MRVFWFTVGVLLLGWVIWDVIYKDVEPTKYWICLGTWTVLGISCFFSWGDD